MNVRSDHFNLFFIVSQAQDVGDPFVFFFLL